MKHLQIFLLAAILSSTSLTFAQELYLETGKTLSFFDYTNSQGQKLDNLQESPHSFLEVGYRDQFITKKLYASIGASYAGYGAIGSDDRVGNFMEWNVNYATLKLGLEHNLFTINKFSFYAKVSYSWGFLVQGTQTLNNKVFNLKNEDDFERTIINYGYGAGIVRPISEKMSVYLLYMYGKSEALKEGTANTADQEVLKIIGRNLSIGVFIDISGKKKAKKGKTKKNNNQQPTTKN
ncbi:MAG: hypothetical protein P8K77_04320 [Polaribacter sp.]|nr:hypothetical protein [Polaribacter sp.]